MASFETLPTELLLQIAGYLSNLKAVDAFRSSAPVFARLFLNHATEIMEPAMKKSLFDGFAVEIRVQILILSCEGLSSGQTDVDDIYDAAGGPIDPETPPAVLGRVLRRYSVLHSMCNTVLREKLQRVYSLRFQNAVAHHNSTELESMSTKIPSAILEPFAPTWEEEQRVNVATWRLENFKSMGRPADFPALQQKRGPPNGTKSYQADEMDEIQASFDELKKRHNRGGLQIDWIFPAAMRGDEVPQGQSAETTEKPRCLEEIISLLRLCSVGYGIAHYLADRQDSDLPILHRISSIEQWPTLRKLGIGFWGGWRLSEYLQLTNYRPRPWERKDLDAGDLMSLKWKMLYFAAEGLTPPVLTAEEEKDKRRPPPSLGLSCFR